MKKLAILMVITSLFLVSCENTDTDAPVITALDSSLQMMVGESHDLIDYFHVSATDNNDGVLTSEVSVNIDDTADLIVGIHLVSFTVSDQASNEGTLEVTLEVKSNQVEVSSDVDYMISDLQSTNVRFGIEIEGRIISLVDTYLYYGYTDENSRARPALLIFDTLSDSYSYHYVTESCYEEFLYGIYQTGDGYIVIASITWNRYEDAAIYLIKLNNDFEPIASTKILEQSTNQINIQFTSNGVFAIVYYTIDGSKIRFYDVNGQLINEYTVTSQAVILTDYVLVNEYFYFIGNNINGLPITPYYAIYHPSDGLIYEVYDEDCIGSIYYKSIYEQSGYIRIVGSKTVDELSYPIFIDTSYEGDFVNEYSFQVLSAINIIAKNNGYLMIGDERYYEADTNELSLIQLSDFTQIVNYQHFVLYEDITLKYMYYLNDEYYLFIIENRKDLDVSNVVMEDYIHVIKITID